MLAQKMLGKPQLSHNFPGGQIATEALMTRRTEPASHCTARLRRNTQRAAIILRDKNGLYRITSTDVEQPLDGAVF